MISRKAAVRAAAVLVSAAVMPLALPVSSALAAARPGATAIEYGGGGQPGQPGQQAKAAGRQVRARPALACRIRG